VYVAREVRGIRLTEAAKYVGRDLSTVSLAVKRLDRYKAILSYANDWRSSQLGCVEGDRPNIKEAKRDTMAPCGSNRKRAFVSRGVYEYI